MKVPEKYYDEIFDFKGQWDVPSKCGLKTITYCGITHFIVTELYQDNPGTSVTYAGYSLMKQICESKGFSEKDVVYLECNPDTHSKLSFYDEEVFQVSFPEINGGNGRPAYRRLSSGEIKSLFL
jgi:hypothetical protein